MKTPLCTKLISLFLGFLPFFMATSINAGEEVVLENVPQNICGNSFRIIGDGESAAEVFKQPHYFAGDRGAEVIKLVPAGTEVLFQVSDRTGDWSEISLKGGLTGWVRSWNLRSSSDGSSKFNGKLRVKTLDGSNLNIRESPSLSAKKIGSLETGTIVTYKGFEGYWTKIVDRNNIEGFVSSKFLVCADSNLNSLIH
ncbi:SH3 domain-containing protein [Pseudanabaena galeata UHCC 0370]|uniref:SH3 domain-containing protein n=2 Tax=Pseudanabaena galeata TaxID=1112103 RepID=A0ABU5TJ23_9CYAN|nr:SH3 domain-containing protein [Pseudanabaena galeata UHCC 0370]